MYNTKSTKRLTALFAALMLTITMLMIPQEVSAADYASAGFQKETIKSEKGIVQELTTKNKLCLFITNGGKKKTRYIDIYKSNKKGEKVAYIATVKIKTRSDGYGRCTWKKASGNTYYRLYVKKSKVPWGSYVGHTKK